MPARRRLSHLLLASHVGLVLLLAVLLLAIGAGSIRTAVTGQARIQAEQATAEARRRLQEWRRELHVGASLLAEQPTLQFYLGRGQLTKARELVADFHQTSGIDFIRVRHDGRVVAEYGAAPPVVAPGLAFGADGSAWRIVQGALPELADGQVVLAERLGNRLAARPTPEFVETTLQPLLASAPAQGASAWDEALYHVSTSGDPETLEAQGNSAAARIVRVRDESGQPAALLVARVGQQWVEQRTLEWLAAFGAASLATCALALVLAAMLAARIARPFAALMRAAERLGGGDLETPVAVPASLLREPAALAASLEQMRLQVQALTAAERSQRRELDAVLDGVDEGIAGIDAGQRIHYANRQFLDLLGRARADVLGQSCDLLLRPLALPEPEPARGIAPGPALRLQRCQPAGRAHALIMRRLPASGDRQVLIVREETALEAARAMRDTILANLSHEFQTPLSAQMASIELLRDHLRGSPDQIAARLADAQYRGALRLSQLVDNLLDSVRIESGEMRLRQQPVDLPAVVREAVELMQPLTDQRDQRVVLALPPGPQFSGDPQRLFSVLVNLLANANKFAPDQSTIRVELAWLPRSVTVWVEDEGPGLPPLRAASDLFAPFRRAPDQEPSQRGTGLGLAIVRAVVEAHGGEVRVAAPLRGRGARLGVVLPLAAEGVACAC